jgi:hypothetical protein
LPHRDILFGGRQFAEMRCPIPVELRGIHTGLIARRMNRSLMSALVEENEVFDRTDRSRQAAANEIEITKAM